MKLLNKFMWWGNILFASLLLITYVIPYVNPVWFWPVAVGGILFPYIAGANLLFVLYWLFQRKYRGVVSVAILLTGWGFLARTFQVDFSEREKQDPSSLKLLSYNVQSFGFYDWGENIKHKHRYYRLIKEVKPAVCCLQEYFTADFPPFNNTDSIREAGVFDYHFFHPNLKLERPRGIQEYGLAIFSKYPIRQKGFIPFGEATNNGIIYADIEYKGDTIRVFNVHLQSLHFQEKDYEYLEQREVDVQKSMQIFRKLKRGYQERPKQLKLLIDAVKSSDHPVIIAGDLNDIPHSYTYQQIKDQTHLQDAFVEGGQGFGHTYAGPIPFLRIDYLFLDTTFRIVKYQNIEKQYSDHYPLVTVVQPD